MIYCAEGDRNTRDPALYALRQAGFDVCFALDLDDVESGGARFLVVLPEFESGF